MGNPLLRPRARLALVFGLLLCGSALARSPLFPLPTRVLAPPTPAVEGLPAALAEHARELRADCRNGYDWVFPMLSERTTRHILRHAGSGLFDHPELIRADVAQFFELYAINHNALISGAAPEPGWARATRLARWLAGQTADGSAEGTSNEERAKALVQAVYTVWVHVVLDLPRALMMAHRRLHPGIPVSAVKEDFFRLSQVFGDVIEEMIQDAEISPPLVAKLWPKLPGWMRRILTHSKLGFGSYLHALRRVAWMRFRWLSRIPSAVREVDALPVVPELTPLLPPAMRWRCVPSAPGAEALPDLALAIAGPDLR